MDRVASINPSTHSGSSFFFFFFFPRRGSDEGAERAGRGAATAGRILVARVVVAGPCSR